MILEQTAARQTKLLSLLRREFGLSAGLVKRLKWQNALFVNGAPAHTDAPVTPGDRVRVVLEERTEGFDPEPLPLSILYEDECFLAVDKPSGMLVHPSPQKNSGTLANGVLYHLLERGEASASAGCCTSGSWKRRTAPPFSASRRSLRARFTCLSIRSAAAVSSVSWTNGASRR